MDLLPHTQQVIIQRAGAFGHVYSKLIKIEDLEHVTYDSVSKNGKLLLPATHLENYFWGLNYQTVDPQLIFRDKSTGELFMFDKTGVWNR
jgi:hypothetical protein